MPSVLTDRDSDDEATKVRDLDVVSWRYDQLLYAGYPTADAVMLAERGGVDLHVACRLLERGASVHEALRILN